jgi:hypothetical protein
LKLGEAKPIKDDRFKITGLLWFGHTVCCGWSRCEGNRKRVFFQPSGLPVQLTARAFHLLAMRVQGSVTPKVS